VSPTASQQTKLPGTCDDLLADYDVDQALGVTQLAGADQFVVGQPERDIHRIGYLNCRYGVTGAGAAATPKVEIGISLYETAKDAAARINATSQDYTAHGATSSDVPVGTHTGTLLTGGTGAGYAVPLLVAASGQRTVAVSIDPSVASGAQLKKAAVALAALALQRTGG
jgi:hypothetical protein